MFIDDGVDSYCLLPLTYERDIDKANFRTGPPCEVATTNFHKLGCHVDSRYSVFLPVVLSGGVYFFCPWCWSGIDSSVVLLAVTLCVLDFGSTDFSYM